jgi:hypothetical protein
MPDACILDGSAAINTGTTRPSQQGWPDSYDITDGKPDIGAYSPARMLAEAMMAETDSMFRYY